MSATHVDLDVEVEERLFVDTEIEIGAIVGQNGKRGSGVRVFVGSRVSMVPGGSA